MKKESSQLDTNSLLKYMGGGAMTGAGVAALLNYIKDTRRLVDESTVDTSLDDDVLYVKGKKGEKKASEDVPEFTPSNPEYVDNSSMQKFVNLTGAVGAGLAGYGGVKWLYNKIRRKQLQDELDDTQVAYMKGLTTKRDKERKKYASLDKSGSGGTGSNVSTGGAGVLTGLMLLALASGVISYKTLDEAFPRRKRPGQVGGKNRPLGGRPIQALKPKQVKLLGRGNKVTKTIDTDGTPTDAEELESLIRTTTADPVVSKQAGFDDLIAAVANGRTEEIKNNLSLGIEHTFTMIKGAALTEVSEGRKNLAIGLLARDPMLKAAFAPVFAAEFSDMSPRLYSAAVALSEQEQDMLCKVAADFNKAYRHIVFADSLEKNAAALVGGALGLNKGIQATLDEGTTFFSSGSDSIDDEANETEEDPEETVEQDMVDGFFDKKMDKSVKQ